MEKKRMIAGIILFGSIWGFSECIIGSYLRDAGLPAGAIMTAIFAIGLMTATRILYKQPGMQLGMGVVAGTFRLINPFTGCFICSAIAIMAEGAIFELMWYHMSRDLSEIKKLKLSISMGIISAYVLYVAGSIVTQITTPLLTSAGFHFSDLLSFLPQILSRGLLAALIGGKTVPAVSALRNFDISSISAKRYYATSTSIAALCWIVVILNTLFFLGA